MANPADSQLNTMLQSMATGSESETKQLLDRSVPATHSTAGVLFCVVCSLRERGKGPYYGGELVDQAVNAVFAALIWHCQDLREELTTHPDTPSQLLQDAFSTAEGLRRELVHTHMKTLTCSTSTLWYNYIQLTKRAFTTAHNYNYTSTTTQQQQAPTEDKTAYNKHRKVSMSQ